MPELMPMPMQAGASGWRQSDWSRFPRVGGLRWHVQCAGQGPVLLLLHGTGSAGHSWRGLLPGLMARYTVVAPDLPGHGRTGDPGKSGLSVTGMAERLRALLDHLGLAEPLAVVGHSAGAALACRMCIDGQLGPARVLALNGALLPPLGFPLQVFTPLARLLASAPLVSAVLALQARDTAAVTRLIAGTGSQLDDDGLRFYRELMSDRHHVSAALRMMAWWDLEGLARDLPRLAVPLDLLVADGDRTIAPQEAARVQVLVPASRIFRMPALGHLAHEEDPEACLRLLLSCLEDLPVTQAPLPQRRQA